MRRNSRQESDGIDWTPVSIPLGGAGLDLRRPDAPGTLSELLNARFIDARTVERRDGHTGQLLQDRSVFTLAKSVTDEWVYGHGTRISINGDAGWENEHHPIHIRGGGTFSYGDQDVVWTGDRLLVAQADGAFYGRHTHWDRAADPSADGYGIPAFLPVQVDSFPPAAATSSYVETCLTERYRLVAFGTDDVGYRVKALLIDRETGSIVDSRFVDSVSSTAAPTNVRAINSGGVPTVAYMDDAGLQVTHWTGSAWSTPSVVDTEVAMFDVAVTPTGFHLLWRVSTSLYMAQFAGAAITEANYAQGAVLSTVSSPSGSAAVAVSPDGAIAIAWESELGAGLLTRAYTRHLVAESAELLLVGVLVKGVTVCYRGLRGSEEHYDYVVHVGGTTNTYIFELEQALAGTVTLKASEVRYNALPCSKSFRVGDEVFAWLHAQNSDTNFLIAGVVNPQVCGIADREVATDQPVSAGFTWLYNVTADPNRADGSLMTWSRKYNAGGYFRIGDTRIGDIDFLPSLSAAKFGRSVYVAGSHMRNWDGYELGDAGFNDYPAIVSTTPGASGALGVGDYYVRVYATRFNKAGERFKSVAITSAVITLGAGEDSAAVVLSTLPTTNHDDVVYEVYRTAVDLTGFYLEGTVINNLNAATVSFTLAMSDATLITKPGDPHAPGIGIVSELEEFGPVGCAVLAVAGDRMWSIGGQVGQGVAQFSRLWEPGEGASFDPIAGTQIADASGGDLTSLASLGDTAVVVFQPNKMYVITGSGPDNYGAGAFGPPELLVADGAINHFGTASLPGGIVFWGAGGPRLLETNFRVSNISEPVRPLAVELSPTGVRVDLARQEVVWYTSGGDALLWNYSGGSRWARWDNLQVAGCSARYLVTPDGHLLKPADTDLDAGRRFEFKFATGNIRPEQMLAGKMMVHRIGMVGQFNGPHRPKFKVFYNGAPLWSELFRWDPAENTYLTKFEDIEDLTPAQVDALGMQDRSGQYATDKRSHRMHCRYFRVEVSDCGDVGFTPWELTFELGALPGMGRIPVNTIT